MATRSISPRPGRKLSRALNIPRSAGAARKSLSGPLPPEFASSPPVAIPSPNRKSGHSSSPSGSSPGLLLEPHPPRSLRPLSPGGSPERPNFNRQRRHTMHTITLPNSSNIPMRDDRTHPSQTFPSEGADHERDGDKTEAPAILQPAWYHRPLPQTSSCFKQAMSDLKTKTPLSSQSSVEDDNPLKVDISKVYPRDSGHHSPRTPVIEISSSEVIDNSHYSLDIELTDSSVDDGDGDNDDGCELSRSAPFSSSFHARNTTGQRLIAASGLSSSDISLRSPQSQTSKKKPQSFTQNRLTVPYMEAPLKKWRSTEGSLPVISSPQVSFARRRSIHSPYISSPFLVRRNSGTPGRRRGSVYDMRSSIDDTDPDGSPMDAKPSLRESSIGKTSFSSSSSNASDSPVASPRTKRKPSNTCSKSSWSHQDVSSALNVKTAGKITKFITAAAASSTTSGGNKQHRLIPGAITLPPVLNSSGRLLVHRGRDDSMRMIKQAVDSENKLPSEDPLRHPASRSEDLTTCRYLRGKQQNKSLLGFSEI